MCALLKSLDDHVVAKGSITNGPHVQPGGVCSPCCCVYAFSVLDVCAVMPQPVPPFHN